MRITSLTLENFRNYTKATLTPSPGCTLFVGPNAAGKTNQLEAISFLSVTSSFRASDAALVRDGAGVTRVRATVTAANGRTTAIEGVVGSQHQGPLRKLFRVDGAPRRARDVLSLLATVLFTPSDTELVTAAPQQRRAVIDRLLLQVHRSYSAALHAYRRARVQRNAALLRIRRGEAVGDSLSPWDDALIETALPLSRARTELIQTLNNHLPPLYQRLAGRADSLVLAYRPSPSILESAADPATAFREYLVRERPRDIALTRTQGGPHRDDVTFLLNDQTLSERGSRGEQRSAVFALKVAEARVIEDALSEHPIFLLDDVLSELDEPHRQALATLLHPYQVFLTATERTTLPEELLERDDTHIIEVRNGALHDPASSTPLLKTA